MLLPTTCSEGLQKTSDLFAGRAAEDYAAREKQHSTKRTSKCPRAPTHTHTHTDRFQTEGHWGVEDYEGPEFPPYMHFYLKW